MLCIILDEGKCSKNWRQGTLIPQLCTVTRSICLRIGQMVEKQAMGETIAPTHTPKQKAGCSIVEELRCLPRKSVGAPEQQSNTEVAQNSQSASQQKNQQCTSYAWPRAIAQHLAQSRDQFEFQPIARPGDQLVTWHIVQPEG
jgi:hypothetical protein